MNLYEILRYFFVTGAFVFLLKVICGMMRFYPRLIGYLPLYFKECIK